MDRIRTLIADDEEIIRRGLARMIGKDPSIELVAEAEDGELALQLFLEKKPDLALVDINMPFLDGLSFIDAIKNASPSTEVIVISGYDDFDYARKAIRLGVFAYLLKPVHEEAFFDALERVKLHMRKKRDTEQYLQWAKDKFEKNKELLISNFLRGVVTGSYEESEIEQEMKFLGIVIPKGFSLFILRIVQKMIINEENAWNDDLLYCAAKEFALTLFPGNTLYFRQGTNEIVFLCPSLSSESEVYLRDTLKDSLEKNLPADLTSVSARGEGYAAIPEVFSVLEEDLASLRLLPKIIVEAESYLKKHCQENTISLLQVSDYLQVTPQHLSRLFKSSMNSTFVEFLTILRIQRAMTLLEDPEKKIYEVADEVGYSTQHYFCTAFKRVMHISPHEYRKSKILGGQ